ncbi:ankyrin repeat domain-containing protein [Thalassotalea sp. G20_0]|uniref:ankyrin repeat domain-containing protein n=1 Tax=Thalassotalea sp. G20_0 TaxID=2821093 RepID=UPI001AD9C3A4|nr:ankyrin repeat domain-containing protein [Thalassotalea sp. G20_0]MBO9494298.1 ankyrin repeat domain-containing protein [Thalassotalea sp. G20_0]
MVKLNQVRPILGHPSAKSCDEEALLEPSDQLPTPQMVMDILDLPFLSKETSSCQHTHLYNSSTALINLIKQGDTEKVKECITNNPFSLAIEDAEGNSVLHLAVLHGHENLCRLLVDRAQYLLQVTNNNGERPLHIAARTKQNNCLNFLLNNCPSFLLLENELLFPDKSGLTPVHLAAKYGNKAGLKTMLDYGIGKYLLTKADSPIWGAIKNGRIECVAVILRYLHTAGVFYQTYCVLRYAVECGRLDCVKWLVQNYPDSFTPKDPDLKGLSSLTQLAVKHGYDEILQYLLEQPFFIKRLTKMEYAAEFSTKEKGVCAKLIRDAREKVKQPFRPVKNFDKTLFQQTWQREKNKIANKNTMVEKQASRQYSHPLFDHLDDSLSGSTSSTQYLSRAKALISALPEIGVYVRCPVYEDKNEEQGRFWAMGDATASVELIKALVALGAKTIHVQLSPPDDSDLIKRQKFNSEEQIRYVKKQRIALSKLAYLLPGIKIRPGIQEIYIDDTKVIISSCNLRSENKINAAVTLSFLEAEAMCQQLGYVQESYISLKPYRFYSEHEAMYLDTDTSVTTNNNNNGHLLWSLLYNSFMSIFTYINNDNSSMPDCNIHPLHLPVNSIIPSGDLQSKEAEISTEAFDSHQGTLVSAINHLCDLSAKGKLQTAVVYGLHHNVLHHLKKTILTNWLSAIKLNQGKVTDAHPVVVTTTLSAFRDEDREENGKSVLSEIARTTGFTLIDFRDQQDRASLMAAGKGQLFLCLMPSLPRQGFNKLVQSSRFPVLSEGANLTTTLLQNGQPHLSLLPHGDTPVAQDMGVPLEALKAMAFSCKLQIEKKGAEIEVLKKLSDLARKGDYTEALSYIDKIKTKDFESGPLGFVWNDPQPSPLQLRPVTIMSLLQKGAKLGSIEKKALLEALDPSDKAFADYIHSCLDKDSITTHHFRLQQMHVNKPFNNKVVAALLQFGRYKKLLA